MGVPPMRRTAILAVLFLCFPGQARRAPSGMALGHTRKMPVPLEVGSINRPTDAYSLVSLTATECATGSVLPGPGMESP